VLLGRQSPLNFLLLMGLFPLSLASSSSSLFSDVTAAALAQIVLSVFLCCRLFSSRITTSYTYKESFPTCAVCWVVLKDFRDFLSPFFSRDFPGARAGDRSPPSNAFLSSLKRALIRIAFSSYAQLF